MKKSIFSILLLLFAVVVQAQIQEPVKFKSELKTLQAGEAELSLPELLIRAGMCTRPIWAMADLYQPHSMSSPFQVQDLSEN